VERAAAVVAAARNVRRVGSFGVDDEFIGETWIREFQEVGKTQGVQKRGQAPIVRSTLRKGVRPQ
jgi:hypothetical protein